MLLAHIRNFGRIRRVARLVGLAAVMLGVTGCTLDLGPAPPPTPTSSPLPIPETASASGRVWHDLCALPLGESPPRIRGLRPLWTGRSRPTGWKNLASRVWSVCRCWPMAPVREHRG
jgi:hypothetical protein